MVSGRLLHGLDPITIRIELVDGVRAVTGRRWYLLNLLAHATWNFAIASFFVLGPIVAKDKLGGASAWGLIAASVGASAVFGGLVALRVRPKRPLLVANLMFIPAVFQVLALAIPLPVIAIVGTCIGGWIGLTFLIELSFAAVSQLMPADVLARATSFNRLLSLIAMPIGFPVAGPLAEHVGARTTLLLGAAIMAACADRSGSRSAMRGSHARGKDCYGGRCRLGPRGLEYPTGFNDASGASSSIYRLSLGAHCSVGACKPTRTLWVDSAGSPRT